jgi:hypothetical protein
VSRALGVALALCLLPIAASAQTGAALDPPAAADQPSQGPMIVERVHNGFLVTPDFKITEIDHRTSGLAGGYAGIVFDDHFFVGGGAYVLATGRGGREMAYGGLVLQWLGGGDGRFGWSTKTLLGGGYAETPSDVHILIYPPRDEAFRFRQTFFVAEPELDALVRITSHVRLAVGAGYRFTGTEGGGRGHRDEGFNIPGSRLNGVVGSIGLQIGGGS